MTQNVTFQFHKDLGRHGTPNLCETEMLHCLSFDERGHQPNAITYAVLGTEGDGTTGPVGFFPALEDFVGEGGTLE
jgi:hypothetical protein